MNDPMPEVECVGGGNLTHVNRYPVAVVEWAQGRLRAAECTHLDHGAAVSYLDLRSDDETAAYAARHFAKLHGRVSIILVAEMDEANGVAVPTFQPLY